MLCNIRQGIWRWGIYLKCNGLWMLKNMFYVYAAEKRWPKQTMNLCVSSLRGAPNYRLILNSVPHTFNNSSRDFIYKSCFFYRDILAITVRWFDTFFLLKFAIWRTTDITSTIKLPIQSYTTSIQVWLFWTQGTNLWKQICLNCFPQT